MQTSQWKSHCKHLKREEERQIFEVQVAEKDREIDELSTKDIEAAVQLEHWESWWQEGSTDKVERQEPIDEPSTPFVISQPSTQQQFFATTSSAKVRSQTFPKGTNDGMRAKDRAIPAWMREPRPLLHQQHHRKVHRTYRYSLFRELCQVHLLNLQVLGQLPGKSYSPQFRSWISTPVLQAQGQ